MKVGHSAAATKREAATVTPSADRLRTQSASERVQWPGEPWRLPTGTEDDVATKPVPAERWRGSGAGTIRPVRRTGPGGENLAPRRDSEIRE
ncbi:hypothetical protein GmRootV116_24030 [Variovorax sp. V116]